MYVSGRKNRGLKATRSAISGENSWTLERPRPYSYQSPGPPEPHPDDAFAAPDASRTLTSGRPGETSARSGELSARLGQMEREIKVDVDVHEDTKLAGAKLARFLRYKERTTVNVESNSVYGAAVLMPQLAWSTSGNRDFVALSISSYAYLLMCMCLHAFMLKYVSKEERVMDGFAGQPYLCDFGADMQHVKQIGPGGTEMTAARLYSWSQWVTRSFVRSALLALFPKQEDDINVFADPGEYGVESYYCRLFCVVIFIMSIMSELWLCINMAFLLWYVPTKSEPWITLTLDDEDQGGADTLINTIQVKVAGMPLIWKIINCVFVLIPKCFLVYFTAICGVNFLMETAGIDDIIVNSVALGFLLTMDELITSNLMSNAANELLDVCEPMTVKEDEDDEVLDDLQTLQRYHQTFSGHCRRFLAYFAYQLRTLVLVALLTAVLLTNYYLTHCVKDAQGRYVSIPVAAPKTLDYNMLNAFFPEVFPFSREDKAAWSLPD